MKYSIGEQKSFDFTFSLNTTLISTVRKPPHVDFGRQLRTISVFEIQIKRNFFWWRRNA